jgi:OmpA-OmpF porin, OOP family
VRATSALAVAAIALAASTAAIAQESGFYLGGAFGQAKFTEWCDTSSAPTAVVTACEDKANAWKILGGYRFNRYVGIEGTYVDWGKVTGTVNNVEASAEQTSMGVAAVGSLPIGAQFSLFGKAGFLATEQETRRITPPSSSTKRSESEFHYGLGAKFAFATHWAARAEWEKTDKLKVEMLSIGVEFRF